ncbi:MAG: sugar transferase [Lachnospiraceae bacterium]|nr:sugar transferase [Lachnospiraceae bacterium]
MYQDQKQNFMQNFILFVTDLVSISVSYTLAILTRHIVKDFHRNPEYYLLVLFFAVILCLLSYLLLNWNSGFMTRSPLAEVFFVFKYDFTLGAGLGLFLFFTQKAQDFSRLAFAYFLIYNFLFTYVLHLLVRKALTGIYMRSASSNKMLVVTQEAYRDTILEKLKTAAEWSHELTGVVLWDTNAAGTDAENTTEDPDKEGHHEIPVVATQDDFYEKLQELVVDEVFIYLPNHKTKELQGLIEKLELAGVNVRLNVDDLNHLIASRGAENFAGMTVLTYEAVQYNFHMEIIKRLMDIAGSLIGMAITIILTPFLALAIKIDSKGPVFYKQKRVGKSGREFYIWKFRSMRADADAHRKELADANEMKGPMFKVENDPRVTKVGAFLRRTSLDEFPQFFNVFAGQMSLVGTRPPIPEEYAKYKLAYRRRMSIKPGITGLWQVSGRSDITDFEEVLRLDLQYIDHWSLGLDLRIILQTIVVIFSGRGAK